MNNSALEIEEISIVPYGLSSGRKEDEKLLEIFLLDPRNHKILMLPINEIFLCVSCITDLVCFWAKNIQPMLEEMDGYSAICELSLYL